MPRRDTTSAACVFCSLAVVFCLSSPAAYAQPADITVSSGTLTPTTANSGDVVDGTVTGTCWSEPALRQQIWYVLAGFRNSAGAWVGGEPVGVAGLSGGSLPLFPGVSFDTGFNGLTAPTSAGTYSVWLQMVPAGNRNEATTAFKAATATVEKQYHKRVGTVQVGTVEAPQCAQGLCASGAGGMIPVIVLGLALMKAQLSWRRRQG